MGVYAIVEHNNHTHLAYSLQIPEASALGEPQEAFNIGQEGSFVISVKNPEQPAPQGVGLGSKQSASFSPEFQEMFAGVRIYEASDRP